jgi:Holliday junction resolvase RusA-like endonuclease
VNDLWFVLDINPEPWAIGPVGVNRKAGSMSAFVGRNQQLDAYKEAVREAIMDQPGAEMIHGYVSITFFFWRRQSEYKTARSATHRKHEADATNMQKATEDALQGILYGNDKDNRHVESYVVDQGPDVDGRVVIRVSEYLGFNPDVIPDFVWSKLDEMQQRFVPLLVQPIPDDVPF